MTRLSTLLLAGSVALAPIAAFAQQGGAPAQPTTTATPATSPDAKAQAAGVHAGVSTKDAKPAKQAKSAHVKTGTTPSAPAKAMEPNKS